MPDVSTEVAIATTTLGSAASTITFSSISSAYTDLRLVLVAQTSGGANIGYRFNSDSGSNYSYTLLYGDGSSAGSYAQTGTDKNYVLLWSSSATSPNWCLNTIDIFSYAGSTNKTSLARASNDANGSGTIENVVNLWRSTSAITSIQLSLQAGTFAVGTTATLYGIL